MKIEKKAPFFVAHPPVLLKLYFVEVRIQIITTKHINHIEHGELLHNNHNTRCPCGLFHDAYHDPFRSDKGKWFIYNLTHHAIYDMVVMDGYSIPLFY